MDISQLVCIVCMEIKESLKNGICTECIHNEEAYEYWEQREEDDKSSSKEK